MYQLFSNPTSGQQMGGLFIAGNSSTALQEEYCFVIPAECSMVYIMTVGAGGGGGGGRWGEPSVNDGGSGAGGGSGGVTVGMFSAANIPSSLYLSIGTGGSGGSGSTAENGATGSGGDGGDTFVRFHSTASIDHTLLMAQGGGGGQGGQDGPATAGTAGVSATAADMIASALGNWKAIIGQAGGTGVDTGVGEPVLVGLGSVAGIVSGGCSGGSDDSSSGARLGGSTIISNFAVFPLDGDNLGNVPTSGTNGRDGYDFVSCKNPPQCLRSVGGAGGGGSNGTPHSGNGGSAGPGSGGGGGGGQKDPSPSAAAGNGGHGGPGYVLIQCW